MVIGSSYCNIWDSLSHDFHINFIKDDRYTYILGGLAVTLQLTVFACLLGVVLGIVIALVRTSYDSADRPGLFLRFLNGVCKVYLTIIRGTPTAVQLLIIYFVIFASVPGMPKLVVGVLAFGINSGAYAAEIFRSGIQSVDKGQYEAGRSLGLSYFKSMRFIILPQAFRNALPTMVNELITLFKETSVASFIGLQDLTRGGEVIKGLTYAPFMPLIAVALIYLAFVMLMTWGLGKLERRLRARD